MSLSHSSTAALDDGLADIGLDQKEQAALLQAVVAVRDALGVSRSSVVKFRTHKWALRHDSWQNAVPYSQHYVRLNDTHGEYADMEHEVVVSSCTAMILDSRMLPLGSHDEFSTLSAGCASEQAENAAAKHLVVYFNQPEGGSFANALEKLLPRLVVVLLAAREAHHKLSVVFPEYVRMWFSANTRLLLNAMDVDVLMNPPVSPHRAVGIANVAPYCRLLRRAVRQVIRQSLLSLEQPADCKLQFQGARAQSVLLFHRREASQEPAEDYVEAAFNGLGFDTLANTQDLLVDTLSMVLFQTCSIAAMDGDALANLIFLPDAAEVLAYGRPPQAAVYWLWSHALGLRYIHLALPSSPLDQKAASEWAAKALGRRGEQPA